jgi:ribosomal protein L20A (L18A)
MNKNLAKNKGTKKYRGGSKGKSNLSKRIRIPEKKEALADKITSYLGGRRKTKKRNTNKKRNKTRSKK